MPSLLSAAGLLLVLPALFTQTGCGSEAAGADSSQSIGGAATGASCRRHSDCEPHERCKKGVCQSKGGGGGCVPACNGAECGDDGCGGECGTCSGGETCSAGTCTTPAPEGVRAFPGARGFGTDSPCGRGGKVFVVNSQADLDDCIGHNGARVCVFETSGTFTAPAITNPYITIAGQTAPSPGIQISPNLQVRTHDVCVFHTRFRGNGSVGDVIHLNHAQEGGVEQTHHIVFDHVSVSWSTDENFSSYCGPGNAVNGQPGVPDGYVRNVTLSNSISSEGLLGHSMGFLAARPGHENFSVLGNLFIHNNGRNPKLGSGAFVVANNLVYNHGNAAIALGSSGGVFDGYIVGNSVLNGPNTGGKRFPNRGQDGQLWDEHLVRRRQPRQWHRPGGPMVERRLDRNQPDPAHSSAILGNGSGLAADAFQRRAKPQPGLLRRAPTGPG